MIQFNEEGISQITSLVGGDADDAIDTIKKVINLGKDYQSFAGKADDMDGSVTFIYKTKALQSNLKYILIRNKQRIRRLE